MKFTDPHRADTESAQPILISFSGLDGSGKTTQIERLCDWLTDAGLQVCVVRFWDDVATMKGLRERVGHAVFGGERGVGAPGKPVRRRDKNVQSWFMLPVRIVLCALDGIALSLLVARLRHRQTSDVIIFDRYLYDQIANMDPTRRGLRNYCKWLLSILPRPEVALVLDVDPIVARERKPEYPIEFLCRNRCCYFEVARLAGLSMIPLGAPDDVENAIRRELVTQLAEARFQRLMPVSTSRSN